MNAPKCRLCGTRHYAYQDHAYTNMRLTKVDPLAVQFRSTGGQITEAIIETDLSVTKLTPTVTETVTKPPGRPKRYETQAERQKAYRERKKVPELFSAGFAKVLDKVEAEFKAIRDA